MTASNIAILGRLPPDSPEDLANIATQSRARVAADLVAIYYSAKALGAAGAEIATEAESQLKEMFPDAA